MDKLYVVVRADLPPGAQAVQSCHAALQFAAEHPETARRWFESSNYLALLSVPDEAALEQLVRRAERRGARFAIFREPDLTNSITAVAFEPGDAGRRLCSSLPLTLAPVAQR